MRRSQTLRAVRAMALVLGSLGPGRLLAQQPPNRPARVVGTVYDSLAARPLVGANVQLDGIATEGGFTRFATSSDSGGRFAFEAVPDGKYVIGFYHPALDTLGLEMRSLSITVSGRADTIALAVPSPLTLGRMFCPPAATKDSDDATLIGHLLDAQTGKALANGAVTVTWPEPIYLKHAVAAAVRSQTVTTRGDGWFAACGVLPYTPLTVRGELGPDSSGRIDVEVPVNGFRHVSLYAGHERRSALAGRVHEANRNPIRGARVSLWGGGAGSGDSEVLTDSAGRFVLPIAMTGTQTLYVRAIGFAPAETNVSIRDQDTAAVDILLDRVTTLPTVVVLDSIVSFRSMEFDDHKKTAPGGYFIAPVRLDGQKATQSLSTLVAGLPGFLGDKSSDPKTRSTIVGVACRPSLFLNGDRKNFTTFKELDAAIDPDDIIGVEVYTREFVPTKYAVGASKDNCGAIVIWTRPGPGYQ